MQGSQTLPAWDQQSLSLRLDAVYPTDITSVMDMDLLQYRIDFLNCIEVPSQ